MSTPRNSEDYMMMTGGFLLLPGASGLLEIILPRMRHLWFFNNWVLNSSIGVTIAGVFGPFILIWILACTATLVWSGFNGLAHKRAAEEQLLKKALARRYAENLDLQAKLEALTSPPQPQQPSLSAIERLDALADEYTLKIYPDYKRKPPT